MLILTEKPSVAKDFAAALGCRYRSGTYTGDGIEIANCVGHLFRLQEPEFYNPKFKSWNEFPIIPEHFRYTENESVAKQAAVVKSALLRHRNDDIVIATDADREGEIIARECLAESGITDFSRIRRFWVSQALTPEVVRSGLASARPLSEYNSLAANGFGRQHSDWLVGYNFTRYITVAAGRKLTVGRVQTAVLSAIDERCSRIENFKSQKYFEHRAVFSDKKSGASLRGIYFEAKRPPHGGREEILTAFPDNSRGAELERDAGKPAAVLDSKSEKKENPAPPLYNLNALQKDAFRLYGYSADETLTAAQRLYEEHKCISYPRTPSKVMGSQNVDLCRKIFIALSQSRPEMKRLLEISDISLSNKRVFNDARLEAHHALIPLSEIPEAAGDKERKIYSLVLARFSVAFAPPCVYEKRTVVLSVNSRKYKVDGQRIIDSGWKKFDAGEADEEQEENAQDLTDIDLNALALSAVETEEKWTRPPKHFNEATILAFMENPKSEDDSGTKLVGLGTQATRHTFIPKLTAAGYIETRKKNIEITDLGRALLKAVRSSPLRSIADVSETTDWERRLEENPSEFERGIALFVRDAVSGKIEFDAMPESKAMRCPKCGRAMRRGKSDWYCAGYRDGCSFKVWESVSGARLSDNDVSLLCEGKHTRVKKFKSKGGREFKARLFLGDDFTVKFDFTDK